MRLIVSGSTGFVGRHLLPVLEARGHEVTALRRKASDAKPGQGPVLAPADLSALRSDALAGHGAFDGAIHLAALNPDRRDRNSGDREALLLANRDGTAAFAEACARAKVPHLVLLSTANVHAAGDAPVHEGSQLEPKSAYARSKLEAERVAGEIADRHTMRLTILRPAPVYGRGGRGMIAALQRLAMQRLPVPLPNGLGARSVVSIGSLVDAILAVLERDGSPSAPYLVADDGAHTPAEIIAGLRLRLARRPAIIPVPSAPLKLATKPLGLHKTLENFQKSFVIDWRALAADTTWQPEADTIRAMMEAMRARSVDRG